MRILTIAYSYNLSYERGVNKAVYLDHFVRQLKGAREPLYRLK